MAYNHQQVRNSLTPEQYSESLYQAYTSYLKARSGGLITCSGCGEDFKLHKLFRCYFCRKYFCSKCAGKHFE
jgi:hypothetical protein